MIDADAPIRVRNEQAPWNAFSSQEYWRRNYATVHPEDLEIIDRVSRFFLRAFSDRRRVQCAVDVGSGSNLYPALLMLPWTDQILLTDYSEPNVSWLSGQVMGDGPEWDWLPFWRELGKFKGYDQISEPQKQLRAACAPKPGSAGIERLSVFDLPAAKWQLGTMFFVAESITQEYSEFCAAISSFVRALQPGSPFAAAFMAGSRGYTVDRTSFPALQVTADDVCKRFTELGASELDVHLNRTSERVRPGYEGMIVATGIAGER
ncbi:MAG TPA: SCO2525 family SAM-dependent methyltransferase [Streptosporangiaceae bacterium]|nr:SCO2525 family SAM-dependent methyltransferase [Streptosporangiaceae bacterium]